jgi:pimeloyl-ACP methyl ester carboxylesterase
MKKLALAVFTALMIAALGASAGPPPRYFVNEANLPFDQGEGGPSTRLWGVLNNAGFRIEVPDNWNGSLVMWAHGFRGDGLELTFTEDDPPREMRKVLIASGFAWAASTYSKNRYDPAQGAKDTHALARYFFDNVAQPRRVYIVGASMGGHVTAVVAEQWPQSYDGALPVCGVLGDYELFDYFLDFNLAAQTLSGQGEQFPFAADYLSSTVPATKAALGPAFPFPPLSTAGQNFKSLVELRSGGVRPVFESGFLFWNGIVPGNFLFGLGTGDGTLPRQPGVAVQNSDVEYHFDAALTLTPDERAFNESIQRITADRQGRRIDGIANVPPTTGNLRIPMLTLHTLGDLFVPFHMEQEYARRVAAHGGSHLLVQRATRDFGHCSFTPIELGTAFTDLVAWVEFGVKPAGDNVLDPAVVADPNYGCLFTDKLSPRFWDGPGLGFLKPAACPAP